MKTNDKLIKLLEHGFNGELLSELNEGQINTLYKKLSESKKENKEAVTTKSSVESTKYTGTEVSSMKSKGQGLQVNGEVLPTSDGGLEVIKRTGSPTSETTESEMNEDSDGDLDLALALQSKEISEKFESKSQQKYFWAKCDRSTGKEKKKWCDLAKEFSKSTTKKDYKKMPEKLHPEKTVKVKKSEKTETIEKFLEKKISEMVESKIQAKMSKKDLIAAVKKKKEPKTEKSMIIRKPKKMNMFSDEAPMELPIGRMFSIGETK
jgi:hypothetical protein